MLFLKAFCLSVPALALLLGDSSPVIGRRSWRLQSGKRHSSQGAFRVDLLLCGFKVEVSNHSLLSLPLCPQLGFIWCRSFMFHTFFLHKIFANLVTTGHNSSWSAHAAFHVELLFARSALLQRSCYVPRNLAELNGVPHELWETSGFASHCGSCLVGPGGKTDVV